MAKKNRRPRAGLYQTPESLLPAEPTDSVPGTRAKVDDLARRVASGQALHDQRDLESDPGRARVYRRARNGTDVNQGHTEGVRPDPGEKKVTRGSMTYAQTVRRERLFRLAYAREAEALPGRIEAARRRRRWTQGRLALASGVPQPVISRLERGRQGDVGLWTLWALADALGVSLDELVGRGGPARRGA